MDTVTASVPGLVDVSFVFTTKARKARALEARREELGSWVEEQRTRVSTAERLPGAIQSFLADFESLDVRHQKAQLQAILKSAYVYRDDRLELEFRGHRCSRLLRYTEESSILALMTDSFML